MLIMLLEINIPPFVCFTIRGTEDRWPKIVFCRQCTTKFCNKHIMPSVWVCLGCCLISSSHPSVQIYKFFIQTPFYSSLEHFVEAPLYCEWYTCSHHLPPCPIFVSFSPLQLAIHSLSAYSSSNFSSSGFEKKTWEVVRQGHPVSQQNSLLRSPFPQKKKNCNLMCIVSVYNKVAVECHLYTYMPTQRDIYGFAKSSKLISL